MSDTIIPCEFCNQQIPFSQYTIHAILCMASHASHEPHASHASDQLRNINTKYPKLPVLEKTECPICFNIIKTHVRELECNHVFCVDCIDEWFKKSLLCPICKRSV
uniref:Ring finger domain protein n=1 Tax=Megaviridae environmental sample TaxID=1737588 RepID=A0A5J6VJC1_9VIRU|nr:MAG: ring finger domain protein [Megaviridae environmental sample]